MPEPTSRQGNRSRFVALAAGSALIAAAAIGSAGAGAADKPAGSHLVSVPETPRAETVLESTSAKVVANYDNFSLVEANAEDTNKLRSAGADVRDDMRKVSTADGSVDPGARTPLVRKKDPTPDEAGLALVQFVGPVKDAWLARLNKTGVRRVSYVPQNAYVVYGSAKELGKAGGLVGVDPAVRAVTPWTRDDKLESGGAGMYAVQTPSGGDGADARTRVDVAGSDFRADSRVGELQTQYVRLTSAEASALAANPAVFAVQPYRVPKLLDEKAAQIVANNLTGNVPTTPDYLSWLAGEGFTLPIPVTVDITDEGIDTGNPTHVADPDATHQDFHGPPSDVLDRLAYAFDYTSDDNGQDCGGHGTNTASIATGYNVETGTSNNFNDADGFNYGLGIAPRALVGASKIFACGGAFQLNTSFLGLASAAWAKGARISSNSWGSDTLGDYDSDSQAYDALVRDSSTDSGNQEMVEVFANGNDGPGAETVGSPGTGKNVISVGASENVRNGTGGTDGCTPDSGANSARDVIDFSSRGPTADGRIKPDLVAPGTHVTGAKPQVGGAFIGDGTCLPSFPAGNPFYTMVSGTSQATPEVSGSAALVRNWYEDQESSPSAPPSPALTKAILINAATDIEGGNNGGVGGQIPHIPNKDQGWGRVNMANVLDGTTREYRDQLPGDLLSDAGDRVARIYNVADTGKPVKVSLVWTDAFGPIVGDSWVNDLDLTVQSGSTTFKGNVFSSSTGLSTAGGTADRRNNVENVFLPAGTSGSVTVRVTAANLPGDGLPNSGDSTDQDFALVVSNATEVDSPVLDDAGTTGVAEGADDNTSVDPGEAFTFKQQLANSGDDDATGTGTIPATASSTNTDISFTDAAGDYPTPIAAGTTEANTDTFGATLGGADCGEQITGSLAVTTNEGAQTVPFTLQTGGAGPSPTRAATDLPKPIPDEGSVSSTITAGDVGVSGIIRDVNVRIADLRHTWDGDLRITLESPDGTVVTLADRPDGVNNNGDNFTNTVFDDEASSSLSAGAAPYTGTFRPQTDQLSRFDGENQAGDWTLTVSDLVAGDTGTLNKWATDAEYATCEPDGNADPTASVAHDPVATSFPTGQNVTFNGTDGDSDGTIKVREWDLDEDGQFDDGNGSSVVANFKKSDSNRIVEYRVTDDQGNTQIGTDTVQITNRPPAAAITQSTPSPLTNQNVTFSSGSSSDPDGTVASRAWDLDNDGQFDDSTGTTAVRTFPQNGNFTIGLQVTDDEGASNATTFTVAIGNRPPVASFSASPQAVTIGQTINFSSSASDSDGSVASQAWDLDGDGQFNDASGPSASRAYAFSGTYTVSLLATDDDGSSSVGRTTVTVGALPPPPPFTASIRQARASLTSVITRGLQFRVTCTVACDGRVDLILSGSTARKLKLQRSRRSYVAGKRAVKLTRAGSTTVLVKFNTKVKRRLRPVNSLSLTARLRVNSSAGASNTSNRKLRLRR